MAPKKAKGKKEGKGKAKAPKPPPEPLPPPELSDEVKALIKQIEQLQKDVETEMKARNNFQLEVDMLRTFWEVTGQELAETNAEYVNLFNEIERDELSHRQYIKEYLGEIKLYREDFKKHQEDYKIHVSQVEELEVKPYEKKRSEMILDEQQDIEDIVNTLKNKNNEDMARRGQEMKEQLLQTEQKYKKKLELLQHDLTNKEKTKLSEREYYWSSLIHNLQQDHDRRYSEFDAFLDDCKKKDLLHKDKLKKQIQVFVATEENKNKRLDAKDVKMIKLEQKKVQSQIVKLQKMMRNPIKKTHPNETVKGYELNQLKRDYDLRDKKLKQLECDMDEMRKTYQERLQDIKQRADQENAELQSKLDVLSEKLQKLQAVVCTRLFGIDFSAIGVPDKKVVDKTALDSQEDARQEHWSRKTRLNQTVIWHLQNVKELLQRDVETAIKERSTLIKLINEKLDEVFQVKLTLQKISCQMEMATMSKSGKGCQYNTPEPLEPPIHLQDDRSPMAGLMEEIVKIVCKNRTTKTQNKFSTLVFDQILDTQLRNSKQLLQSHAEMASKRRTQLILMLNDKTHELHGLQRKVKETNQELDKQKLVVDQNKSVEGALLRRRLM
ncbi:dynein regulatory complex subunit 4-like [Corythoichthys intestinalis]|uniref:dynein regulatory complex subunit 4-like n=1 Tax=Corythoichthys intestinalis TaxID=161448 RepID=UPI0025A54794|nr:dynein regulatory complex subunit 4-like [Corythoichthys intestinalis]